MEPILWESATVHVSIPSYLSRHHGLRDLPASTGGLWLREYGRGGTGGSRRTSNDVLLEIGSTLGFRCPLTKNQGVGSSPRVKKGSDSFRHPGSVTVPDSPNDARVSLLGERPTYLISKLYPEVLLDLFSTLNSTSVDPA